MKAIRLLQILVSLGILVALCLLVDLRALIDTVLAARWAPLLGAAGVVLLGTVVRGLRWMVIINKEGREVGVVDSVLVTMVGDALNIMLPANTGDVAKSVYAYQRTGLRERAFSGSVADKLIALMSAGIMGLLPSLWYGLWDLAVCNLLLALTTGLLGVAVMMCTGVRADRLTAAAEEPTEP